ncbi:hypothetical protein JW905_12315 [bacterium]|nr:hypothetical protein [candidate division CSSED10-310 bacterium]
MAKPDRNRAAAELFTDPSRPMTYGWLEKVMSTQNTGGDGKRKKSGKKKNKRPFQGR